VDKSNGEIIAVSSSNGRKHDYRLFKESNTYIHKNITIQADTGYTGLNKRHSNTEIPKKRSKKAPLTRQDKQKNRELSSSRVLVENVIRCLKIFRILAEKYRNRRKRFGLRLNLIAALCNWLL